jgi:pyrimidine operon attenuation protein/uracil phosphoribosyltransferase
VHHQKGRDDFGHAPFFALACARKRRGCIAFIFHAEPRDRVFFVAPGNDRGSRFAEKNLLNLPTPLPQHSAVPTSPKSLSASEIHAALDRLAAAISQKHPRAEKLLILGIANGGMILARRLVERLAQLNPGLTLRLGTLDISFHRDDIDCQPIPKEFAPTHIPIDVTGATILLVDDVLFSGRTVKAALDEIFDHGRPATVELAVLVDRGHRRLPLVADFTGLTLATEPAQKVVVTLHEADPARDTLRVENTPAAPRVGSPKS